MWKNITAITDKKKVHHQSSPSLSVDHPTTPSDGGKYEHVGDRVQEQCGTDQEQPHLVGVTRQWLTQDRKPSLLPFSLATRMRFWRILGPVPEKSQNAVMAWETRKRLQ